MLALLPAIGHVRRGGQTEFSADLSLLLRIALLCGAAIAVLTDAYVAGLIDLALGDRFAPVGEVVAELTWFLGPYATIVLACQSLNAMGARCPAAIAGMTLVGLGIATMVFAVPVLGLSGASLSFGLAVLFGCGLALCALRSYVEEGEPRSWLLALTLNAVLWAVMQLDLAPIHLLAPLLLFGAIVVSWYLRMLRGSEIAFVLRRFSLNPSRPLTHAR